MLYSNHVDRMLYSNELDGRMFCSNHVDGRIIYSYDFDGRSRQKRPCSQSTVTTPKQCLDALCRDSWLWSDFCTLACLLTFSI